MVKLKSYRLKIKKGKPKKKRKPLSDIVLAGTGAIIGVSLLSTLANTINQ